MSIRVSATSRNPSLTLFLPRQQRPLAFNAIEFLRFVTLTFITAPPNYMWQQLLERTFPAYPRSAALDHAHRSPRVSSDGDPEKRGEDGTLYVEEERPKLDLKNTLTKWFVDCITLGAIFNTIAFLVIMGIMKGQSSAQIGLNIQTVSKRTRTLDLWLT